jgi:hypothetical protein
VTIQCNQRRCLKANYYLENYIKKKTVKREKREIYIYKQVGTAGNHDHRDEASRHQSQRRMKNVGFSWWEWECKCLGQHHLWKPLCLLWPYFCSGFSLVFCSRLAAARGKQTRGLFFRRLSFFLTASFTWIMKHGKFFSWNKIPFIYIYKHN